MFCKGDGKRKGTYKTLRIWSPLELIVYKGDEKWKGAYRAFRNWSLLELVFYKGDEKRKRVTKNVVYYSEISHF